MLQEILRTALHSAASVSGLFILARLMGKKQIAQLNFFDYIIGISIGSIAAQSAVDPDIHYTEGFTGMIIFTVFSIIFSLFGLKSYWGRKLLEGTPVVLIENGKIIEQGLKKTKLSINDLLEECRQKNAFDIADIEFAILETSGRLSVLLKASRQPVTPIDMQLQTAAQGICTCVIIDGKILKKEMALLRKDKAWLLEELLKQDISETSDVLLAYVDSSGSLQTHLKNIPPVIVSVS